MSFSHRTDIREHPRGSTKWIQYHFEDMDKCNLYYSDSMISSWSSEHPSPYQSEYKEPESEEISHAVHARDQEFSPLLFPLVSRFESFRSTKNAGRKRIQGLLIFFR